MTFGSQILSPKFICAARGHRGASVVDRRASERVSIRYAILPRLSAYVRVWHLSDMPPVERDVR